MSTILSLMESIIGKAPDYFTVGNSSSPQWDYGALLEYSFAGILMILSIAFVYKLFISLVTKR